MASAKHPLGKSKNLTCLGITEAMRTTTNSMEACAGFSPLNLVVQIDA
jgi:hypothetical protein